MEFINFNREKKFFSFNIFAQGMYPPRIIMTEEEAIERGLDHTDKKGHYVKIEGIRVPVDIE